MPLFQLKNHLSETGIFFFFFWNWELSFWTRYLKPYGQSSILSDPIPLKGNAFHIPPTKKKKMQKKTKLDDCFFCSLRHKGHCLPTFCPTDLGRTSWTWSPDGERWGGLMDARGKRPKGTSGSGAGLHPKALVLSLLPFSLLNTSALPF